jgi:hypothetical protein
LGEVRVRFSGDDKEEVRKKVQQVVEQTRAAGILVRPPEVVSQLLISGIFYVIPEPSVPATATETFRSAVVEAMEALTIGQPLSVRRLNALVYQAPGLADVAEAKLISSKKTSDNPEGKVTDPYLIERTQLIRPDKDNLQVVLLKSLKARRKEGSTHEIELWLEDAADRQVKFNDFSINISVTLRAFSKTALEQPPERVGSFTTSIRFVDTSIAILTMIQAERAPDFRSDDHKPQVQVIVRAAAYPGLQAAEATTVDFSVK